LFEVMPLLASIQISVDCWATIDFRVFQHAGIL